jgi:hypothetical protein
MPKSFKDMVAEGREGTPMVSPQETQRRMQEEPNTLVVDVRDAQDLAGTGIIPTPSFPRASGTQTSRTATAQSSLRVVGAARPRWRRKCSRIWASPT